MTHISGFGRGQLLLLPEAIDDYVGCDNPARFIDAFVARLDLAAAGVQPVAPKVTAAADERLDDDLRRLDAGDIEEASTSGSRVKNLTEKIEALRKKRGEYEALRKRLERSGESQISLSDPDSRAMAAHTKVGVGYNVQIAVDAKHKMIVEQAVTNDVLDMGLLAKTAEPAREVLGVERIDVVADMGYFKSEDIEACETAGLMPHLPPPPRGPVLR